MQNMLDTGTGSSYNKEATPEFYAGKDGLPYNLMRAPNLGVLRLAGELHDDLRNPVLRVGAEGRPGLCGWRVTRAFGRFLIVAAG